MTRNRRLAWLLLAAGVSVYVGACLTLSSPKETGKAAVRGIRPMHKVHTDQGLDCTICHEIKEGKPQFPTHELCSTCHDINVDEPDPKKCGFCHTNENFETTQRTKVLTDEIKFDHDKHAPVECTACHKEPDRAKLPAGPKMPFCMNCHATKGNPKLNECATCHVSINEQTVPLTRAGQRIPHDSPEIWKHVHGRQATVDPKFCATCHEQQAFCDTCHAQKPPESHTLTWRQRTHGLQASWDRQRCAVCHEEDSCQKCHRNTQPQSHKNFWGKPANRHCVSCHYPPTKTECVVCHENIDHKTAIPSPHRIMLYPPLCAQCHPGGPPKPPHPANSTARCQTCH